jgi:hypothetical protein
MNHHTTQATLATNIAALCLLRVIGGIGLKLIHKYTSVIDPQDLFFNLFGNYNQANLGFPIGQIGPTHNFDYSECEIYIPVAL